MSPEYLIERINEMPAEVVEIYERNVTAVDMQHIVPVLALKKGNDFAGIISRFCKQNRGTFTAMLRAKTGGARAGGERIAFNINPVPGGEITPPVNGLHVAQNIETPEEMRARIMQEVRREIENERLIEEIREMQRQQVVNSSLDNRLANVLERLLSKSKFFNEPAPAAMPIQGTAAAHTSNMGQHDIEALSAEQVEALENSVAVIYSHLGLDTMHKVAAALTRDPGLADKLKFFI